MYTDTMVLCVMLRLFLFFFFKQKTAYEMRISDWSSDVCSSDLRHVDVAVVGAGALGAWTAWHLVRKGLSVRLFAAWRDSGTPLRVRVIRTPLEIGRASCRERVCQYV